MTVARAIDAANAILPGRAAPEDQEDPRWQAIIAVGDFIESDPLPVWEFTSTWGDHADEDLRAAIATCLLEHLLEHHFDLIFPLVQNKVRQHVEFLDPLVLCARFGQASTSENARQLDELIGKKLI